MKYLKKYKLFEQVDFIGEFRSHVDDPIIAEIYDYLLDLFEDDNFEVEIGLSWGLESKQYNIKYKDRFHLLKHKDRRGVPTPIRIIIHKIKDDDQYEFYHFDEVESMNRMVDILSDRFDCVVDSHEHSNGDTILYSDIILLPKI